MCVCVSMCVCINIIPLLGSEHTLNNLQPTSISADLKFFFPLGLNTCEDAGATLCIGR